MAAPAEPARTFVADARAAALLVPVDPRATGCEAPGADARDSITVSLGGSDVEIRPSRAEVRGIVARAYLLSGFDLVVSLEGAVRRRVDIESLTLRQLESAVRAIHEESLARPRYKAEYANSLDTQLARLPGTRLRLASARSILDLVHEEWARVAAAEESVLREYEAPLVGQFARLALDARTLALREWARYEPYDTTAGDEPPIGTAEAKGRSIGDLRLRKEAQPLVKAVWELYDAWKTYLDQLDSTRMLAGMGARSIRSYNPGADPRKMIDDSRANGAAKFQAFHELRSRIGTDFPAALQVYGKLATLTNTKFSTSDAEVERMVIGALIEAVASAQEIGYQAVVNPLFQDDQRMRVVPGDSARLVSSLAGYQQDLLARGLAIPASRIVANALEDIDDSARSPWLQLPARLALVKRAEEGDARLSPYFTPGRLHHAALGEVNNALAEVRRRKQEKVDQALLVMDAIAMPAGFLTGGAAMAVAGTIHAVVRGREMYLSAKEYQARDSLASIALLPLQQAIWDHPSAVKLTGKLLSDGFEIATDLVNGGVAGAILDTVQVALAITYGAQAVARWVDSDSPSGGS